MTGNSDSKGVCSRPIAPSTKFFNWFRMPMIFIFCVLLVITLLRWLSVYDREPISIELKKFSPHEFSLMAAFCLFCYFLLCLFIKYADSHLKFKLGQICFLVGFSFMVLFLQFVWVARYTSIGIFALGGSRYWVGLALSYDEEKAKIALGKAMNSNNYGVNNVMNAVASLPEASQRYRMFMLLASIAPNDNWKEIYTNRANENNPNK